MAAKFAGFGLITGLNLWLVVSVLGADTPKAIIQPQERAMIQEALEKSADFAKAVKGKKKVVASTMVRYKEMPEGAVTESEFAEALHFDYDTGKTIRTVYDITGKKVVRVDTLEAYPTPLAGEEITQAKEVAEDKDERVKALYKMYGKNQVDVEALAPVIADRENKRFGKRLAILVMTPKEKPAATVSVTVNLTDKTVSRE